MSDMDDADRKLFEVARRQHQVFTTEDAVTCGLNQGQIDTRVEWDLYVPLHRGVFTFGSTPQSFWRDAAAAVAAGGSGAFATGPTAAELWGLPGASPAPIEITCPRWGRARPTGLRVRERIRIAPRDLRMVEGIRCSRPELTVIEVVRVRGATIGERAFHEARRKRLMTYDSMVDVFVRHARRGVPGIGGMRAILDLCSADDRPNESPRETMLLQTLRRAGLPTPDTQVVIRDEWNRFVGRSDFGYSKWRITIEYHSRDWHSTPEEVEADERKRNRYWKAGWIPIVARRDDLTHRRGADFLGALRQAIALREAASASNLRQKPASGAAK